MEIIVATRQTIQGSQGLIRKQTNNISDDLDEEVSVSELKIL